MPAGLDVRLLRGVAVQVALVVSGLAVGSFTVGWLLDLWLNTRPVFMLLLFLGSAPVGFTISFLIASRHASRLKKPTTSSVENQANGPVTEEERESRE